MASVPATANRSLFDDEIPADIVSPSAVCGPEQPDAAPGTRFRWNATYADEQKKTSLTVFCRAGNGWYFAGDGRAGRRMPPAQADLVGTDVAARQQRIPAP
jgi:hypothetical protein